jgi:hypothetical protein
MTTVNWCKKIEVECDLNQLLVFARKQMLNYDWVGNNTYELIDKNSKYWQWNIKDIDDQNVQTMIYSIENNYKVPIRFENSYLSIWEFGEGDKLPPHVDPDVSQSASVVVSLIGRFELRLHGETGDKVVDVIQYGPGEGIILNNTVHRHSGECIDGYRLSLLLSIDPNFKIKEWFNI